MQKGSFIKKLNDEYPSLTSLPSSLKTSTQSSLQKSPQNSQVSSAHNDNKTKNVIPQMSASQQFELFGVKSPEAIFQSDFQILPMK